MVILFGIIIVWALSIVFTIKFFISLPASKFKKFVYKTEFMALGIRKELELIYIDGYIYNNGEYNRSYYRILPSDIPFVENIKSFEIIYRYSKTLNPNELEYYLFSKK